MTDTLLPSADTKPVTAPRLPIRIETKARRRSASAQIRGTDIQILMPSHWSKSFQEQVTRELANRVQRQFDRDWELVSGLVDQPMISFTDKADFEAWVHQLNRETLRVPLKGIRMGHSRYTQLAQMNLRTHVMTVSRYCLTNVPESALRYLVVHELSHLNIANHSPAFWQLVQQFVPDYRHQRRLMAAVHRIRLYETELKKAAQPEKEPTPRKTQSTKPLKNPPEKPEGFLEQLLLKLHP